MHCFDICLKLASPSDFMVYFFLSQLCVNRSVCTGVDVSNRTSAPVGADTQALFAPGGWEMPEVHLSKLKTVSDNQTGLFNNFYNYKNNLCLKKINLSSSFGFLSDSQPHSWHFYMKDVFYFQLVWDSHTCETGDVNIEKTGSTWKCIHKFRCVRLAVRNIQLLTQVVNSLCKHTSIVQADFKKKTYQRLQMLNWTLLSCSSEICEFLQRRRKDVMFYFVIFSYPCFFQLPIAQGWASFRARWSRDISTEQQQC